MDEIKRNVVNYKKKKDAFGLNHPWWEDPKDQAHHAIFNIVKKLHHNDRNRMVRNLRCMRLYGSSDAYRLTNSGSYLNYNKNSALSVYDERIRYNVCSSMVDTVHAKIGKMKPRVSYLTEGGTPSKQRQAKDLSKFMLGAFYMNDIYTLHKQAFRDSMVMDIGALKHYVYDDKIVTERVLSLQLYTDPSDSLYGKPKSLYQVSYLPKSVARALYPEHVSFINSSTGGIDDYIVPEEHREEYVCIVEAWRLPVGSVKGRHCIILDNCTISDEEYDKEYFPFTWFRWAEGTLGFWGQSLVDRLTSIQLEINKMLRMIQQSFHLGSSFKVFLEHGSKVAKSHINNDIGSIIYYLGTAPQFHAPKLINDEYFQHLRFLIQSAYEEAGISQLAASSRKPAGLESGKALREYNDIESERFATTSQGYEGSFLQTARIYQDLAREIGSDYAVVSQSKNFVERIKWGDVAPADEDAFIMQMFPVSMLPHEPAGRLAFVQELINGGLVPPDYALQLLDFPDLESYMSIKNAALEDLLQTLESILEGKYTPPEPYQDLQNGIPLFQSAYLRYRHEEMKNKDTVLENLRLWMSTADALLQKAKMAAQGAAPNASLPVSPQSLPGGQTNPQTPAETQLVAQPAAPMI